MAQTKRKRKHRGNAAGIVERPAHNSRSASASTAKRRPQTKEEMRAETRRKRQERMNRRPTWKGATQRAAVAASLFAVLIMVIFKENVVASLTLASFMLLIYIPLSYMTDRAIYNWRQKKRTAPPG